MSILKDPSDKGRGGEYAQLALLGAVPALLVAGPAVGFFSGQWLDGEFGTDPYLSLAGVIFGFVAAGFEIAKLVKKSEAIEKQLDKKKNEEERKYDNRENKD